MQLATQFYACIRYISTNHSPPLSTLNAANNPSTPPPSSSSLLLDNTNNNNNNQQPDSDPLQPDNGGPPTENQSSIPSPEQFAVDQRELARDLILKEQQIEYLISVLPGIGTSELEQEERVRALVLELKNAEEDRRTALKEREEVLGRLDRVITGKEL